MPNVGELKIKLDAVIDPFLRKMKDAEKGLSRSARRLNKIGNSLSQSITVPFLAAGAASAKFAADVETGFTKIDTLVGITGAKLDELKNGVAGLSSTLGQSQGELADGLFVITSAGQRGAEALQTLEQASKASQLGLGAVNDIGRVGVSVANAYGESVISAADAIDVLTAAARVGNFETASFAPAIGKVLPLAQSLGISFQETAAQVSQFTKAGVSAPEAITGLKSLLSNIVKPSKAASDAFEAMGLSIGDLQKSVKERGLAKTLIDLNEGFAGNTTELAKIIPNVEGLVAALATAGANGEDYVKTLEAINNANGVVDEGFEKVSETANFKFNQALVGLQNAAIKLGAIILPTIKSIADGIIPLIDRFNNMEDATKKTIVSVAAFAASIGPTLKVFAALKSAQAKFLELSILVVENFKKMASATLTFAAKSQDAALSVFNGLKQLPGAIVQFGGKLKDVAGTVVANFKRMSVATISFDKVLRTTAIGIITVAVAGLAVAVGQYAFRVTEAEKSQKMLIESTNDFNRAVMKEQAELATLFDVLKSGESTQQQRNDVIKQLNDRYPEYLKNIDLETAGIGQLAIVQSNLNKQILETVAAQKKREANSKFYNEIVDKELRIQEIRKNGVKALGELEKAELTFGDQSTRGGFLGLQVNESRVVEKAIDKLRGEINVLKSDAQAATDAIDEVLNSTKKSVANNVRGIGRTRVDDLAVEVEVKEKEPTFLDKIVAGREKAQAALDEKELELKVKVAQIKLDRAETKKQLGNVQPLAISNQDDPQAISQLDQFIADAQPAEFVPPDLATYIEQLTQLKETEMGATNAINQRNEALTLGGEIALAMGEQMAQAAANGAQSFQELAQAAIKAAAQIVRAYIQQGVAAVIADSFKKGGLFGLAVGAAAGAAAAGLFNKVLGKIKVPKLKKGGLAYGPTMAMVGDNPNSGVDPEVIAPLSKLSGMMQRGGTGKETLETRISGNDLVILLKRAENYLNRTN